MNLLIGIFTFVLILVSLFMVLVVLAQKAKSDGGMGAALGGGAAEATFGAETGNVLTKATINAAIAFFLLSLLLYLGHIYVRNNAAAADGALPTFDATPAEQPAADPATAPVEPAPSVPVPTPEPATP
ncbi:MAG TPA: preprotein translocase subunit SecG [Candidatus Synoicihabitans sp.]|nr:preprotein translocase subunit SecG [Candidatus Synoicihabitans sp.]